MSASATANLYRFDAEGCWYEASGHPVAPTFPCQVNVLGSWCAEPATERVGLYAGPDIVVITVMCPDHAKRIL